MYTFYFILQSIELEKLIFDEKTNYKLVIRLFNQKFSIPIFNDLDKFHSKDEVELNLSKIFYFFTNKGSNLKQILKNEEVDFRIVLNDDLNNPIAQCQTNCLSFFDTETKTVRVKNTLNFFSNTLKFFKCQVYIGLTKDGKILSENIPLYSYKLTNSIYLTEQDYFSHHPLPDDWYELYIPPDTPMDEENDFNLDIMIDNLINDLEFTDKRKVINQ